MKIKYQYADWGCDNPMDYVIELTIRDDHGKLIYGELLK